MPRNQEIKKVLVIGSGPIVIGQAAEFDYAGTQACRSLKEEGVEVVLVNSNPATIMTDKDIADQVYIEPLTVPVLEQIIAKEKPDSILPTLGGQAGLNLGMELSEKGILDKYGVKLIGTTAETIFKAEDRQAFKDTMEKIGEPCAASEVVHNVQDGIKFTNTIGYPVVLRPAYTLGGSGGHGDHDEHHGQHHQAGQDVGAVGQHAHQLAGGKACSTGQHDHAGTQPGNQQDAGVNGGHHQRRVEGKNFFSTQQQILHIAGCLFELFTLVIFAHIRFDHADGGNIFLHALVQVIVLFECGGEVVAGAGHDEHQTAAQNDDRHQIDGSQLGVDGERHDHGNDHAGRRTDGHTQNHLVSVLDVGHVGGHTGDQTGGGIFIDIGKTECLDIAVHGAAQIAGVTGGSTRTKHTAQHAEQQAKGRCHDHPAANAVNVGKIADGNAIINDGGHQLGDDHFHHHFADHAQRGQDGNQPEPLCFFVK